MQDSFGRTALHVAATCGAVETVSVMRKFEACDINPVDSFGHTPLDNAHMKNQRAIAALLEEAGALPGSDPSLAARAEEVREWMQTSEAERRTKRMEEVMASLPEEQAVQASTTAVQAQKQFVQVPILVPIPGMNRFSGVLLQSAMFSACCWTTCITLAASTWPKP